MRFNLDSGYVELDSRVMRPGGLHRGISSIAEGAIKRFPGLTFSQVNNCFS